MIQIIMALALFVLAGARIPSLRARGNDVVFMSAAFAGASSLLASPIVYVAVDPLLGGMNITKLAVHSFMILGLWHLRKAALSAVGPKAGAKLSPWRRLPLFAALVLQTVFFIATGPTVTTTSWGATYEDRLGGALFSMTAIIFIAWSCAEIAANCFRYLPRMRRSFKVGFTLVGSGAAMGSLVMLKMAQEALSGFIPWLRIFGDGFNYALFEMIPIVLVGVGLTIPALAGRAERRATATQLEQTMAKVSAIRTKVLDGRNMDRVLQVEDHATPQEHIHRMIVEIWDADLAAGPEETALTFADREYMLLVESDFDLERVQ